jgi:hypothetical protein
MITTGDPAAVTVKTSSATSFGVRNSASLPITLKNEESKSLFISRFSPEFTADEVEKSLKEKLSLKKLA